jgi:cytochrome oxidase assembly protein ShyY1
MTGLTVLLLVAFVALGRWQWGRGEYKQQLREQFLQGGAAAQPLGSQASTALPRYTHVSVTGRWDGLRQFLLDNRTRDGQAGFEVLTPLVLDDGRWLLVNRGWLPFRGYRDQLPDVTLAATSAAVTVNGRLDELPSAGLDAGRAPPAATGGWPRVTSYPTGAQLAAALGGVRLESRVLLLDAAAPGGYQRDWQPPGRGPETHWSYAIQWWSFAVLLLVLYVTLNLKKTGNET